MRLTFSKTFHFSASHRLWDGQCADTENRRLFGKCTELHGHNFELHVSVSGTPDQKTGMIIPAQELEELVQEHVIQQVDHRHLNEVPWLEGKIPTTEIFVAAIWEILDPVIAKSGPGRRLEKLILQETPKIYASIER